MSLLLDNPGFWKLFSAGELMSDSIMQYVMLDKTYSMRPLIRNAKTTFTSFATADAAAQRCRVIVNGNYFGVDLSAQWTYRFGTGPAAPSDTTIQGQIVESGKVIAGDSQPNLFWFGQMAAFRNDRWPWTYQAGFGNPPIGAKTMSAIGGVGPIMIGALQYGDIDLYKPGGPVDQEVTTGEPPAAARPFLIQRSNQTFRSLDELPPQTGKTILAYCGARRNLLVAVQQHGSSPGVKLADLATALAKQGFDTAVFLDGSDSATLIYRGQVKVAPATRKDDTIDVGVGFFQ